jgi:hypothetical protein
MRRGLIFTVQNALQVRCSWYEQDESKFPRVQSWGRWGSTKLEDEYLHFAGMYLGQQAKASGDRVEHCEESLQNMHMEEVRQ